MDLHDERIRIEVSIGFDSDTPEDAVEPLCHQIRSDLLDCNEFEMISVDVRGKVGEPWPDTPDEARVEIVAIADFRTSDADNAEGRFVGHVECCSFEAVPVTINAISVGAELMTRRREAIAAQKAKRRKPSA